MGYVNRRPYHGDFVCLNSLFPRPEGICAIKNGDSTYGTGKHAFPMTIPGRGYCANDHYSNRLHADKKLVECVFQGRKYVLKVVLMQKTGKFPKESFADFSLGQDASGVRRGLGIEGQQSMDQA